MLKLFNPILYQLLWTLLNSGHAKYVYIKGHCSSFPDQRSHISMKKRCTKLVLKTNNT